MGQVMFTKSSFPFGTNWSEVKPGLRICPASRCTNLGTPER